MGFISGAKAEVASFPGTVDAALAKSGAVISSTDWHERLIAEDLEIHCRRCGFCERL
jgi:hypothetical protein